MADDTRDSTAKGTDATTVAASGATPAETPQKLPKGYVLGKDGKPCRMCNTLADLRAQTKTLMKGQPATEATTMSAVPSDCPPDVEQLGRSSWTLLHSIAATYPEKPSSSEQNDVRSFMQLFSKLYPCWVCAEDFQKYIKKEEPKTGSRDEFGRWLCAAHNAVNTKLGKKTFDCNLWQERWVTGWKDGRCD